MTNTKMVTRKTWEEFRACKLLWWTNRLLHTFGWAIITNVDTDGNIVDAYPARVRFRGFNEENETAGFIGLTEHLKENVDVLLEEAND